MLTTRVRIQLVVFVLLGLVATTFLSARYVGIDLAASDYTVTATLPDAGGTFDNGEVTFRGVPVGRITDLQPTADGVRLTLRINSDAPKIPDDVDLAVANRSAIGEQYVDLRGGTESAGRLRGGDRLSAGTSALPPSVDSLLRSGTDFVDSVPQDSLTTVVDETYDATKGASGAFQGLLESSQRFQESADRNFVATQGLIENSDRVLSTQVASSASIKSFSQDLDTIASTLQGSDGGLRRLIESSPAAAREFDALFRQVGRPLGVLMGNLITPAQVFGINASGVEDTLITLPKAASVGWTVTGSKGLNLSLTQTYFAPLPCTTGYAGTPVRDGLQTGAGQPFNLQAGCRSPNPASNVRGPKAVGAGSAGSARTDVQMADSLADLMGVTP